MADDLKTLAHDAEVTVWVGKSGIESVAEELNDQLRDRTVVKVKFLRASRGGTTTDDLAEDLAERVNADVVDVRGHTAVYHR
ncbi:YhbY family RNA-binding protein [Halomarina salina]|uniref:YhbY family RNA-binding protein n=1 Tax=Halomarina salina TaxID=1872699 RepID=A0ABD5RJ75_9EURY|nr:YhbY family RNA-binding protein [Halomarina salina]